LTQAGNVPQLLAVWQSDVYLVLTSTSAPNTATILDYAVSMPHPNTLLMKPVGSPTIISISTSVLSVAALPDHQLLLLLSDGMVQRLQVAGGTAKAESVVLQGAIAPSLPVSAQEFTATTPVPVPALAPISGFLSVSQATLLAVGWAQEGPHVYVVDSLAHRLLELAVVPPAPAATPSATATTSPAGTGGATAPLAFTMQLVEQYSSSRLLAHVTSLAPTPKDAHLSLLTQGEATTVLTIDTSQKMPCEA
jgi:hypothetical protein